MNTQENLAALAQRAIPFLLDEGAKYEDDGSNEPLELARDIEQALSEHGEVVVTTDESGRCVAVTRQDSEGRILSTIWEASEHGGGGGGEAAPFAYVLVEGNPGSCAELMFQRDARKGERGAKAAWRELGEGLHPLYLHPPVATEPVAKLVNRIDSDGGKTTTFIRPTALGMDLPLGEYPLYTTPPTPSAPACPECKAALLYECPACSASNYPKPPSAPAVDDVVRRNDDGSLDEVVGTGDYHLEQMDKDRWSLRLGRHLIGFHSKRAIRADFIENDLPAAALSGASAPVGVDEDAVTRALCALVPGATVDGRTWNVASFIESEQAPFTNTTRRDVIRAALTAAFAGKEDA